MLVDWQNLTGWVGAHLGLEADVGSEVVDDSAVAVRRYFWALTISAVVTAVLIGGAAWLLGVPLAFTIGVVTLVTSYVPYLGAIVSGAFATLIALGANGVDTSPESGSRSRFRGAGGGSERSARACSAARGRTQPINETNSSR